MRYAAVIAAAGLSSRMHELKPLMKLGSSTIIENVIGNMKDAGAGRIVVITGYKADRIEKFLEDSGVEILENPDYVNTKMLDSVKLGLEHLSTEEDWDYVFISPVDVPLVKKETIDHMKEKADEGERIIRPSMDGKAGHPLLLRRSEAYGLKSYEGEDGIRGFLREQREETCYVTVEDPGILMDADTREDYRKLRQLEIQNINSGRLWFEMDAKVSRSREILTRENVQFLEMIDKTGSIQGACACMHMSYSGGWTRLRDMEEDIGYPLTVRASGGEGGGGTSLSPEGRSLVSAYNGFIKELTEEAEKIFAKYFEKEDL